MKRTITNLAVMATIIATLVAAIPACGGDDDDGTPPTATSEAAPTREVAGEAARPDWFPARFPLPAETTVVSEAPESGGGGTVEFLAPLGFSRVITIMDLNLETPSHGFIIAEREADETQAVFTLDDQQGEYEGTVTLRPAGEQTTIVVTLTPK